MRRRGKDEKKVKTEIFVEREGKDINPKIEEPGRSRNRLICEGGGRFN